ncbi:transcription elongation factor GreA [Kordiimonas sp. SCSIO 12603]|uniref:transcription elongation factor GreA n=1 Tax=Kordiimonas sp. SCSIO 12603 TaxID=2829596 RepID=UPI002104A46A|nr:transcription elongation factor GreA [Kordiimonas sp. SCSIO 12603]UTW60153.1 transcription elongation factor GreA [Kordiimonas sp. SCSIO 12603]
MNDKVPMLAEGHARLEAELKNLKSVERPNVVAAIEEARAHGDLSENAEYHAAKEQQGHIEGRIMELEGKLSRADVIDPKALAGDRIVFGATVTLIDEDDATVIYQIVGEEEGDVKAGRISYQSPIARALIGRRLGDEVEVKTPGGDRYYDVEKIDFV